MADLLLTVWVKIISVFLFQGKNSLTLNDSHYCQGVLLYQGRLLRNVSKIC